MRVVAGEARGRRLVAPDGAATRPTSDRVREAVFNALGSLDAVEGTVVLDLFAGSGAMAIEALSRGAERAVLVEPDRAARAAIGTNLETTGLAGRAEVVAREALAHLTRSASSSPPGSVDLALVDPPYRFDGWPELLGALEPCLAPGAVVVAESDRAVEAVGELGVVRVKRYGGTVVTFLARPVPGPDAPSGDHE